MIGRIAALAVTGLVLNVLWKTGRVQVEPKRAVRVPVRRGDAHLSTLQDVAPSKAPEASEEAEIVIDWRPDQPVEDVIHPHQSKIEIVTGADSVFASDGFQRLLQKRKILRLIPELSDPRVPLKKIEGRLRQMAESFLKQPISNHWDDTPDHDIETWTMPDWLRATQQAGLALFVPSKYRRKPYWSPDGRYVLPYPDEPSDKHALRFRATIAWAIRNAKLKGEYERTEAQARVEQEMQESAQRVRAIFAPRNSNPESAAKAASDE
jgi:hypothetical protein